MSLLTALASDNSIEDEKDFLGGGYSPMESGLYPATVALAYLGKSKGGAMSLELTLTVDGKEVRQTIWVTSGDAKGNKNYYTDSKGEKKYLPGFLMANSLTRLTVGKEISALETEKKVINLYNYEAKAEVPTPVDMLTDLMGQDILVGLIKQTVDKNVKDAAGNYVPSGETREENEIDKLFRASDRKTTAEILAQADASFADSWEKKWTGQVKNKATKTAGQTGQAGAPAANSSKPTTSLFG